MNEPLDTLFDLRGAEVAISEPHRRQAVNVVNRLAAALETLSDLPVPEGLDPVTWQFVVRATRDHMVTALDAACEQLPLMELIGRLVSDTEGMAELPVGTVVRDADGDVGVRLRDGDRPDPGGSWEWMSRAWGADAATLPVTVRDAPSGGA